MNRSESLECWARIAKGELRGDQYDSIDLLAWIEGVAELVLSADQVTNSQQRPYDLTNAIGLAGREDPHHELRDALEIWRKFEYMDNGGKPRRAERGEDRKRMIAVARYVYPNWQNFSDEEIFKRIGSLIK